MKNICLVIVFGIFISSFGCGMSEREQSADLKQTKASEDMFSEAQRQIGMPNIKNFQQRKMLKWIFELADNADLVTYSYIKADMTGKLIFIGKTLGYGVPFSAQFTNPEKVVQGDLEIGDNYNGLHLMKKPQADPNGLFMPTSSSATWVIMIHPETGKPVVDYWEPELVTKTFPMSKYLGTETVILPPGFENEDDWGKKPAEKVKKPSAKKAEKVAPTPSE